MVYLMIDANAIKLEKGFFKKVDNVPKFYEWLGKQPTVDAVPVVRCGECANRKHCEHPQKVDSDWFCADGERKEGAE